MHSKNSLYWYDLETFGLNPKHYRIAQFAGIRTDENLNIVSKPLVLYCKPAEDMLPDPNSCLVTGITPQYAYEHGVCEAEFLHTIHKEFTIPNTCIVGYNNIRFDDEFMRYSLYRNFHDPYEQEWKNGNSRWDILDIVRLTNALRPSGIKWPQHEDGSLSFKLEDLTKANNISHQSAHDALSDVYATIAIAKMIKQQQPKLYDYMFNLRRKHKIAQLLNIDQQEPVLHISAMYSKEWGNAAMVIPLMAHPTNKNGIIVYDLRYDPTSFFNLSIDELKLRLYTRREELPEDVERLPLKTIHINKCPVVVPLSTLDADSAHRLSIDIVTGRKFSQVLLKNTNFIDQAKHLYSDTAFPKEADPDSSLYNGFFSNADKAKFEHIRNTNPNALVNINESFADPKIPEMLFRYRARNYPETLSQDDKERWRNFCHARLSNANSEYYGMDNYFDEIARLKSVSSLNAAQLEVLNTLQEYGQQVSTKYAVASNAKK